MDGVESTRAGVSASAIQEVKLNQDPYSAEFSRPGRGRIEIITKPGSAAFHGTFNFLFRDYRLNARDPFALTRPPEQRRIFEGNFTGPLGHSKKTSFLISANREEEDSQAVVVAQGLSGAIRETAPAPQRNTELAGSMNHQIGENHLISIRGVYTDRTIQNQGVGGFTLPEAGTNFEDREDIIFFNHSGLFTAVEPVPASGCPGHPLYIADRPAGNKSEGGVRQARVNDAGHPKSCSVRDVVIEKQGACACDLCARNRDHLKKRTAPAGPQDSEVTCLSPSVTPGRLVPRIPLAR